MTESIRNSALFDLTHTLARPLFEQFTYPWEILPEIKSFILALGPTLPEEEYELRGENIWIARSAEVAPSASITGPCIIGPGTEVRHCAFIRGSALVGADCVVGNSTELKNVILFDCVQVPHYNYVGDSILGFKAHMGAGAITSNVKSDRTLVQIHGSDGNIATGWVCQHDGDETLVTILSDAQAQNWYGVKSGNLPSKKVGTFTTSERNAAAAKGGSSTSSNSGVDSNTIKSVQTMLKSLKYYSGEITGTVDARNTTKEEIGFLMTKTDGGESNE